MATLSAVFKLFNDYSLTIDKVSSKTDLATNKILSASINIDKFNSKLNVMGVGTGKVNSGLGNLVGTLNNLAVKKTIGIADEYTNTSTRLSLINDGLQTQAELQDKIFAAANHSRVAYFSMSAAISKMGVLAGNSFKNNDDLISFAELAQKSFKLGGLNTNEQSSAMLQLSKSMSDGKLQGDEFSSITENAPMIADAIAKYTGKSKGELKKMSAEGGITVGIMKNAIFDASDQINSKFNKMPMTFADIWNKIKNGAIQVFGEVLTKINGTINSKGFVTFINTMINGFGLVAQAAGAIIDAISFIATVFSNNWSWISPIIWGIVAGLIAYNAVMGIGWLTTIKDIICKGAHAIASAAETAAIIALTLAQDGLNAALALCPITWIIIAIIALIAVFYAVIAAVNHFAGTSISATGIICGVFMTAFAFIGNLLIGAINLVIDIIAVIWNFIASFAEFFANVFNDPIGSIVRLFAGMADSVLGILQSLASAVDTLFGSNLAGAVKGWRTGLQGMVTDLVGEAKIKVPKLDATSMHIQRFEYGDAYKKGYKFGKGIDKKVASLGDLLSGTGLNKDIGSSNNPMAVKGTGENGKVDVNMSDEDIQCLRDIAEREYINKFSTATLAPNLQVSFGDVHETADVNKLHERIQRILQEEIAMVGEGVYNV